MVLELSMVLKLGMVWELNISCGFADAWLGFSGTRLGLGSCWC